jgi:hypothetical protein
VSDREEHVASRRLEANAQIVTAQFLSVKLARVQVSCVAWLARNLFPNHCHL